MVIERDTPRGKKLINPLCMTRNIGWACELLERYSA